jgi:hypothetical protein
MESSGVSKTSVIKPHEQIQPTLIEKIFGSQKIFSPLYSSIEIPPYHDVQHETVAFRAKNKTFHKAAS